MVTNQAIQDMLIQIRDVTGCSLSVHAVSSVLITTEGAVHSDDFKAIVRKMGDAEEGASYDGKYYFRVEDMGRLQYLVCGDDNEVGRTVVRMTALQIQNIITVSDGRFGKEQFFKNLLMDNLLISDIYHRASRLKLDIHTKRLVYLIELGGKESTAALEIMNSLFADDDSCFAAALDETRVVVIRELRGESSEEENYRIATTIVDTLNGELLTKASVAYGNPADEIRKLSTAFKEAKLAFSVGRIFNPEQNIVSYGSLGIGRLIYQLPIPMCRMFIDEIFKDESPDQYDADTLATINQFFANSLNVSETARQLFIHRNTLVYRLDKIQKMTGLDLRVFDDAITFKIALMVVRYMHYMDGQEV